MLKYQDGILGQLMPFNFLKVAYSIKLKYVNHSDVCITNDYFFYIRFYNSYIFIIPEIKIKDFLVDNFMNNNLKYKIKLFLALTSFFS